MFTPTKWTHHFGVFAGLAAALAAIAAIAVIATFLVDVVAALCCLGVFALFMLYFGLYSRHHLVANSPDEEFAALAARSPG